MKNLVINCGSSSVKYQFIDMNDESVLAKGLVERIGIKGSVITHKVNGKKYVTETPMKDHKKAIKLVLEALLNDEYGVIKDINEISAVGHRIVHGGEKYAKSVLIDDEVMKSIEDCVSLAPLHNPAHIIGINACKELMPNTPMVAVFDTAFHQTIPDYAYMYAIPYEYYKKYKVRKYGFHGTSHKYVSRAAAQFIGKNVEDLKMVVCHMGNGASVTAVKNGKSVDTSMGFTPLGGLAMGTRSGDMDPAVVTFLMENLKVSASEISTILNKKSGVEGLSGISSDMRDIKKGNYVDKDPMAILAYNVFNYKIKQFIGSYTAVMNGLDCLVFTGGIGENSFENRREICKNMDYLGIKINDAKNDATIGDPADISADDSKVKVLVIPTNEELMIARDTRDIVSKLK
ncbi:MULTISPECIES: acetate/propionate family kinase [Clostridium]|uniref:acetate/propionate family kinase n=1 Tax=Clostridium TaxID=1485 RepID=UPI0008252889|nr:MULTISPECIES: acetate kinase [Clostridium]PJI06624.1 acetate kinase [Clostridium sp. CT7]